jgi:hypothetical protein
MTCHPGHRYSNPHGDRLLAPQRIYRDWYLIASELFLVCAYLTILSALRRILRLRARRTLRPESEPEDRGFSTDHEGCPGPLHRARTSRLTYHVAIGCNAYVLHINLAYPRFSSYSGSALGT